MKQKFFSSQKVYCIILAVFMFGGVLFTQPADAAGLVPCGVGNNPPCTICHLVIGIKGIIDWGMSVMTFFAIAIIVAMAIVYIVSAGNSGMMTTAKNGIKSTLIGFALMLGSWVIINFFMITLAKPDLGVKATNWYTFTCDTTSTTNQINQTNPPPGPGGNLTCTGCSNIASYIQNNAPGVDPNIYMAIIQAGEHYKQSPCTRPTQHNNAGACGYSQVVPRYHHETCHFSGSDSDFCQRLISDTKFDLDCGAAVVKAYQPNAKCQGIKNLALCYNGGPGHGSCGDVSGDGKCYGDRVNEYYNSCKK